MPTTLIQYSYQTRVEPAGRWKIRIQSYRLGDEFHCTVDNVDPGAVLARKKAATREEAEGQAIEKAKRMLERTRIVSC